MMKLFEEIFVEELPQYYSQCVEEVQKCELVPFWIEFRGGTVLFETEYKLSKIPVNLKEGEKILRIIVSCN